MMIELSLIEKEQMVYKCLIQLISNSLIVIIISVD